jgi:hypothetical protein
MEDFPRLLDDKRQFNHAVFNINQSRQQRKRGTLDAPMSDSGQSRSFGDIGSMSGLLESGRGWAIFEYASSPWGKTRVQFRPALS